MYEKGEFMEIISILFDKVLPIFLLVLIGYKYKSVQNDLDVRAINKFNMTLPFCGYMFYSTYKMPFQFQNLSNMMLSATLLLLLSYLVVYILLRIFKAQQLRGFYFSTLFMNVSFILPVLQLQYGEEGLSQGLCYVFVSVMLFFSLGILLATLDVEQIINDSQKRKALFRNSLLTPLKNPILWATLGGVSLNLLHVKVPINLLYPVKLMGDIMIPLATLMIGYSLANIELSEIKMGINAFFLRLISGGILALAITKMLNIEGLTAKVIILMAVLPTAVFAIPLSDAYEANPRIVSSSLVIGTFATIITLPIGIWLVNAIF